MAIPPARMNPRTEYIWETKWVHSWRINLLISVVTPTLVHGTVLPRMEASQFPLFHTMTMILVTFDWLSIIQDRPNPLWDPFVASGELRLKECHEPWIPFGGTLHTEGLVLHQRYPSPLLKTPTHFHLFCGCVGRRKGILQPSWSQL